MKKVVIIGASGHAKVIADIIAACGDELIGYVDDKDSKCFSCQVILGKIADVSSLASGKISFIIGIGANKTRQRIACDYPTLSWYTACHPSAVISPNAKIGVGTVVMPNVVINTGTNIGCHCIVNTASTIDHDNVIGDFVHLSPGCHLSGSVHIGACSWLGTGCLVSNNVEICAGCTFGVGTVVVKSIATVGTYVGVPARSIELKD